MKFESGKSGSHLLSTLDQGLRNTSDVKSDGALEHVPTETCPIDALTYGKLVGTDGMVVSGMAITARTIEVSPELAYKIRPSAMLGFQILDTSDIKSSAEETGALVIRGLRDEGLVVVQRIRFRPEQGEGARGRVYPQASSLLIPKAFWYRHASQLATKIVDLRAIPDSENVAGEKRLGKEPEMFEAVAHDISRLEHLDTDSRFIADALLADMELKIPPDRFSDEMSFLTALGKAIETVARVDSEKVSGLAIAVGVNNLNNDWIQF